MSNMLRIVIDIGGTVTDAVADESIGADVGFGTRFDHCDTLVVESCGSDGYRPACR